LRVRGTRADQGVRPALRVIGICEPQYLYEELVVSTLSIRLVSVSIGLVPTFCVKRARRLCNSATSDEVSAVASLLEVEELLSVELVLLELSVGGGPGGGPGHAPETPSGGVRSGMVPSSEEVVNLLARSVSADAVPVSPLAVASAAALVSLAAIEAVTSLNFVRSDDCRSESCDMRLLSSDCCVLSWVL